MIEVFTIETSSLGDRSYVATDGTVAVVIDPQRDTDRVTDITQSRSLTITHVFETHIHNDYVTGGYALARELGAKYCVNADDPVSYEREPVRDGDLVEAGEMRIRVIHTPGHTFTHLSYAVEDADGETIAVFTGGSLLYGSTGRPDLLGHEHAETLAKHQYASAHRLAHELPGDTGIFPTHGFGSFCSATQSTGAASTIAMEMASNPVLTLDEQRYVEDLLAGLDAFPAYYAHMGPANSAGPAAVDLSTPERVDPAELRRRIEAGEWVVDLRTRNAFAAGHMRGSLNYGLDGSFVTYLGWTIPWGTPVTLLAERPEDIEAAQRDLARIGIDRPAGAATGKPEEWSGGEEMNSYPIVSFTALAQARREGDNPFVLDVRRADERRAGAIVDTTHVPIHELPSRLHEMPHTTIWIHCAAGYRASIAASLLARAGHRVVHIDDSFDKAAAAGVEVAA